MTTNDNDNDNHRNNNKVLNISVLQMKLHTIVRQ